MTIRWHKSIIITLIGVLFLLAGCAVRGSTPKPPKFPNGIE